MPASIFRPNTWTLRAQVLVSLMTLFTAVMLAASALTVLFTQQHLNEQLNSDLFNAATRFKDDMTGQARQPREQNPAEEPDDDGASPSGRETAHPATTDAPTSTLSPRPSRSSEDDGEEDDHEVRTVTATATPLAPATSTTPSPRPTFPIRRPAPGAQDALRLAVKGTTVVTRDGIPVNYYVNRDNQSDTLTRTQIDRLVKAHASDRPARVDIPNEGPYLVMAETGADGTTYITGVPSSGVDSTVSELLRIVGIGTLAGLILVGVGGNYLVRRNLRPLTRVAATARRVGALKLDSGEVFLPSRVPAADASPHTEVGQVGHALNTMLDNVEGALQARQQSEMRVRQFVADASHELRTPLASIRGYAELSRREREPVPAAVTHAMSRVESEALRMQGLVEDLLLLARLDSGRPLDRGQVDLSLLALNLISDAHAAAPHHKWELELPDEPVEAPGDEARLHQVFANLLANARTHTPEGTVVTMGVRPLGDRVEITVRDNGPGIPEHLQAHVFERFTRADDARNRNNGSTGLGLSIVQAVVKAHHGQVTLRSVPGDTVFTVTLPAR